MGVVIADNSAYSQWRDGVAIPTSIRTSDLHATPINFQELLLMTNPVSRRSRLDFLHSCTAGRILHDAAEVEATEIQNLLAGRPAVPILNLICKAGDYWLDEWAAVRTKAADSVPTNTATSIQSFKDAQLRSILHFAAVLSELARIRRTATTTDFVRIQQSLQPVPNSALIALIPVPTNRGILGWIDSTKENWSTVATYHHLHARGCTQNQVNSISDNDLRQSGCWISHRYLIEVARDLIAGRSRTPEGG